MAFLSLSTSELTEFFNHPVMESDGKGGENMNVASLLFATQNHSGTPAKPASTPASGDGKGFGQLLGSMLKHNNAPKRQPASPAKEAPKRTEETTVKVKDTDRKEVLAAIEGLLARINRTLRDKTTGTNGQAQAAEVEVTFTAEDAAEAKALVAKLRKLLAQLGLSQEEIDRLIRVEEVAPRVEASSDAIAEGQPVFTGENGSGGEEGADTQQVRVTVRLPVTLSGNQASANDPAVPATQTAEAVQGQGSAVQGPQPAAPAANATGEEAPQASVQAPQATQRTGPEPQVRQDAPEQNTPASETQTHQQANTTQGKPAVTVEVTGAPKSDGTEPPTGTISPRELAALVAEAAQDGQEVTVRVYTANQDQSQTADAELVAEEERPVVKAQTEPAPNVKAGEQQAKAAEGVSKGTQDKVIGLPEGGLLASQLKQEFQTGNDRVKKTREDEKLIKALTDAKDGKVALTPETAQPAVAGGYGKVLSRLVPIANVADLLREAAADDTALKTDTASPTGTGAASAHEQLLQAPVAGLPKFQQLLDVRPPVPVQETLHLPQPEAQAREVLIGKLSQRMTLLASTGAGAHEVRLQLKPEHLGDLRIKMETIEGIVKATFIVESQKVQEMLQSGLGQLRQEFQQAGMKLEHFQVSVRDDGAPGQSLAQQGQGQGHSGEGRGSGSGEEVNLSFPTWTMDGEDFVETVDTAAVNYLV